MATGCGCQAVSEGPVTQQLLEAGRTWGYVSMRAGVCMCTCVGVQGFYTWWVQKSTDVSEVWVAVGVWCV